MSAVSKLLVEQPTVLFKISERLAAIPSGFFWQALVNTVRLFIYHRSTMAAQEGSALSPRSAGRATRLYASPPSGVRRYCRTVQLFERPVAVSLRQESLLPAT